MCTLAALKPPRKSNCVKEVERLKKNREERRFVYCLSFVITRVYERRTRLSLLFRSGQMEWLKARINPYLHVTQYLLVCNVILLSLSLQSKAGGFKRRGK